MLEVLQSAEQFREARRALRRRGRSALEAAPLRWMRRIGLVPGLAVGEYNKSWDVARTLELIEARLPADAPVLDLGAFCSEVPVALAMMGYTQVHGIDLNPAIARMPMADRVRYAVGNFMDTPYADASFDAVTAISVIEHGYDPERLLAEVARLLRPGGMFLASFDYWPQKIDTAGTTFFDLSWLIFSQQDYESLLAVAARHGLHPLAGTRQQAAARAIHCAGFDYTFAWTALQKG
jgi:SAM-dependent methyltransferase